MFKANERAVDIFDVLAALFLALKIKQGWIKNWKIIVSVSRMHTRIILVEAK